MRYKISDGATPCPTLSSDKIYYLPTLGSPNDQIRHRLVRHPSRIRRARVAAKADTPTTSTSPGAPSPHAHAKIKNIDTSAAKNAPGVLAPLTGEDLAKDRLGDMLCPATVQDLNETARGYAPTPVLAKDECRM